MRYPVYPSTILNGNLPNLAEMGPPDLRPTSSTAPYYQGRLDSMFGRHLAGADTQKQVGEDREPAYALNELRVMAEMDDTDGAGIFDAPESKPNNYPDAGVFATSWAWPGYLARERMYSPSEVLDSTTGRPIIPVNGGTVSMDSAAQIAFIESGRYNPPAPVMDQYSEIPVEDWSTVNVRVNTAPITPVSGYGEAATTGMSGTTKFLIGLGATGLALGAVYAFTRPKSHTPNRSRSRRRR
jgi:hypothetical protein